MEEEVKERDARMYWEVKVDVRRVCAKHCILAGVIRRVNADMTSDSYVFFLAAIWFKSVSYAFYLNWDLKS